MHLIPSYVPLSKSKPVTVQKRDYSEENCENLLACFETTNWDTLLCDEDSVDHQTEVITDYINFCTDLCIPTKTFKRKLNEKPWITRQIKDMINEKQDARADENRKLYHKLKNKISKEIKKLKQNYSQKIQQHLAKEPVNVWCDIKKLSGLQSNNSSPSQDTKYTADELNTFFARFEKPNNQQSCHETADISTTQTAPTFDID